MKKIQLAHILLIAVIALLSFLCYQLLKQNNILVQAREAASIPEIGDKAYLFSAMSIDGKNIKISKDKAFLLIFFNTNCGECRKSFPLFEEFYEQIKAKVTVVGISDDSISDIHDFMKETKANFQIVWDYNRVLQRRYKVKWEPLLVLIREGKIYFYQQYRQSSIEAIDALNAFLKM